MNVNAFIKGIVYLIGAWLFLSAVAYFVEIESEIGFIIPETTLGAWIRLIVGAGIFVIFRPHE